MFDSNYAASRTINIVRPSCQSWEDRTLAERLLEPTLLGAKWSCFFRMTQRVDMDQNIRVAANSEHRFIAHESDHRLRQFHKKSRGGCNGCKARHVKCDETWPTCSNCAVRGTTCQYSNRARLVHRSRNAHIASTATSQRSGDTDTHGQRHSTARSPLELRDQETRHGSSIEVDPKTSQRQAKCRSESELLELQLMNHWTAHTFLTFCHQIGQDVELEERALWQDIVPQQAISEEYLLNALLALSSLHLSTLRNPTASDKYLKAAINYHNASLELFSKALPNITEQNCQTLYACSLAHYVLGIALTEIVPDHSQSTSTKDNITAILALFEGPRRILQMFSQQLETSPLSVVLASKKMYAYDKIDADYRAAVNRLHKVNEARYRKQDASRYKLYQAVLDELDACAIRFANNISAAPTGWLLNCNEDFFIDLNEEAVLPMLIFMHWAVLLDRPNKLWWSLKSGRSLVKELTFSLPKLEPMEQAACDWCHLQVAQDKHTEPQINIGR